ncbi:transposon Ty3-G Gag-Pol polyprotein [Elysia marginata]|uniref:Transposon Ty3-G Gag-Pol polyprotein n=1 Tax=Elysia marginata TaxID=1093978 RepID=A0AAV4IGL5_9GAST|nr:transposon Ty3-G Gag-Pol polyprotein [Elysia marginata]
MACNKGKITGSFRRSYAARLCVSADFDERINPLHLTVSKNEASCLQRSTDDDTFMCALRVKREGESDMNTNVGMTPVSNEAHSTVAPSLALAEDIIVCVWALDRKPPMTPSPRSDYLNHRPLSIDGDSSDDDFSDDRFPLDFKCTEKFLNHYNIIGNSNYYIRAIQTFPLNKAVFSVSNFELYEWLQGDDFREGLLDELCNHEILVRQNDVLLAPYPESFLDNTHFKTEWYFQFKAIACAPFQIGVMTQEAEIIIFFEKSITSLPSDHRHLSGSHLEQYVEMQSSVLMSQFCLSLSKESSDVIGGVEGACSFQDFFLSSASVIQQMIHWEKIIFRDENFDYLDFTSVVGMPKKLMMQYGVMNGTLMKICLYPGELYDEVNEDDARRYRKEQKPKQKYVKVQRLSRNLDETQMVFISSILLFNLQKGPPVIRSPLLILEKPTFPRVNSETEIDGRHKLSRSVSSSVPYANDVSITIISSPSYTPKANHVESLHKYFQIPRLLSVGDIFAVNSQDGSKTMSCQPAEPTQSLLSALASQLQTLQTGEIAAVSVKLPEFWATSPEMWFARIEAQFSIKNITQDTTKYDYVFSALDFKIAEDVHDVLVNPPQSDKYHSLKCALIKAFGKSQTQRDYTLLNLNGLGDRKPTALLRKINALNDDPQTLKRALFLSNLPADVRTIISGQEFSDLDKLAEAADRIWEARSASIQHITQRTNEITPDCVLFVTGPITHAAQGPAPHPQLLHYVFIIHVSAQEQENVNQGFYLADVTRPILGADFFTANCLAIDLRGKRLLSLDNVSFLLKDSQSSPTLAGLCAHPPNKYADFLQEFPEILTPHFNNPLNKHGVEHHIFTHGPPTHAHARRLDKDKLSAAKAEFLKMEEMGIVRRSKSPWSSPLHIVTKSDGTWRPCGDYRCLKASTEDDRYPLPHIQDFTNHLAGCSIFSKIDLIRGYHQIPMAPSSIPKTAVVTPFGL